MSSKYILKDSGQREAFSTGAVRDVREGKGRFDLISPIGLRRLAGVYERGSVKYADRNWEKGIPIGRCLDSALRHINQYLNGENDEDHLGQGAWNLFAAMHFEETRPDLQDIPLQRRDHNVGQSNYYGRQEKAQKEEGQTYGTDSYRTRIKRPNVGGI